MVASMKTGPVFTDEVEEVYVPGLREYYDFLDVPKDFEGRR
jgi:hypothetical protein